MKKIIMCLMCLSVVCICVGCGNGMSKEEIAKCKEYEEKIQENMKFIDGTIDDMINESSDNDCQEIRESYGIIEMFDRQLKEITLDELKIYHDNYTTENDFELIKFIYLMEDRKLSYGKEIMEFSKDGDISEVEFNKILKLWDLSKSIVNEKSSSIVNKDELLKLQNEMDKKYNLDSNELYELSEKINQ